MKSPDAYRTRYGLYCATLKVLENRHRGHAMWVLNARYTCKTKFPDMLEQLNELIDRFSSFTIEELKPIGYSISV